MEEQKKLTSFDFYRNIVKKTGLLSKDIVMKYFDPIGMTRLMSYDCKNIFIANEVNILGMDKWITYLYYYYGCDYREKVPFLNVKKIKDEEKERIEELAEYIFPNMSKEKIKDIVVPVLKDVLSKISIDDFKDKGGIRKEEK